LIHLSRNKEAGYGGEIRGPVKEEFKIVILEKINKA
jgi:hypothetical protein